MLHTQSNAFGLKDRLLSHWKAR